MTDPVVYFRRIGFGGPDFGDVEPKWHIQRLPVPTDKFAIWKGLCGYERKNLLGDLKFSRAKGGPKDGNAICLSCTARLNDAKLVDEEVMEENRRMSEAIVADFQSVPDAGPDGVRLYDGSLLDWLKYNFVRPEGKPGIWLRYALIILVGWGIPLATLGVAIAILVKLGAP